ncbi:glycosyl hydrolase family 16 protein [Aureococcus anophagefferens]|uniref:Glycosyl hydrolase family 16 protein n=1 Tax=Aureococcus anophagefferens TaxID=44056 RepID=A0ABR1G8X9_AURAN
MEVEVTLERAAMDAPPPPPPSARPGPSPAMTEPSALPTPEPCTEPTPTPQPAPVEDNDVCKLVYGVEWTEDAITYFIDDTKTFEFKNTKTGDSDEWAAIFHWGAVKGIGVSCSPTTMEIDCVRFYQEDAMDTVGAELPPPPPAEIPGGQFTPSTTTPSATTATAWSTAPPEPTALPPPPPGAAASS